MNDYLTSVTLLFVLLNPFLIIIYLVDVVQKRPPAEFRQVMVRGGVIAAAVFCTFAVLGDAVFSSVIQAEFASFQIFGGIIFIIIGLQFVFKGPHAIELLRGESANLAGAIAMPVLIGPGTISASVVIGEKHSPLIACSAVLIAVTACIATIIVLKYMHDFTKPRREALIDRYIEIAGRITALFVGTIAVEMLMQGTRKWAAMF